MQGLMGDDGSETLTLEPLLIQSEVVAEKFDVEPMQMHVGVLWTYWNKVSTKSFTHVVAIAEHQAEAE